VKKFTIAFFITTVVILTALQFLGQKQTIISPTEKQPRPKPLLAYTFESLKQMTFPQSQIILGQEIGQNPAFYSQMFYFSVPKTPNSSVSDRVSGLINIPKDPGTYPVIVMFRGYILQETYKSGAGSQPSASVFAKNGFITLAPDFLGFGESASPSANSFEERFQTYTTALTLLSSLPTLNTGLTASYSGEIKADLTKVGLWGHSNGGQIALSTLAISGASYPTVLWAPVSKSFPYSILYYTDETDDQGKALRKALSQFEEDYDTEMFSPINYYQWIKAPIEINQGENDQEVPIWWSNELVKTLKKDKIEVEYLTYPNADHNLLPNGWSEAVSKSVQYYKGHL
jgi:dipeptidyl aminopeptidase/acylaminoacyl peptidase